MRIAIDIDSTLHHYWDVLSDAALRRFGVDLPYEEQFTWGITRLRPEQLRVVIDETHSDEAILAGEPYPGAVEIINRWHAGGHWIQVTSHRSESAHGATGRWLEQIGLRFDELICSSDKVSRCRAAGVELLIDDNPHDLHRALELGILAATLRHPWNEEVCDTEDVINAADWSGLAAKLEPLLAAGEARRRDVA